MRIRNAIARICLVLSMLASGLLRSVDAAEHTPGEDPLLSMTSWTCWATGSRILCELDYSATNDPPPASDEPTTPPQPMAGMPVRRGSRELPAIAKRLRQSPEQFAGRRIAIPALGIPRNRLDAEELAASVMCSGRPDCRVKFLGSLSEVVLYQDERGDPALR